MDTGDHEQAGGRPAVTVTESQTDEQRRQARQAEHIKDMERLMRGAMAFTRKQE